MKIGYAERARKDIENIATFLNERHPRAAERVGAAIRRTVDRLAVHPLSGRRQSGPDAVRKLVVPGFGYLVYYRVQSDVEILILTIRHPAQERMFEDR